jgi:rhamnosyltransferase
LTGPVATVLIRTKDEAASIGRLLEILAGQTIADRLEPLVVDSGSSDATVAIARAAGTRVIEMPASEFTFGRSLNIGSAEAGAPLVIALSAHAFPRDERWAERMVAAFDDPQVACACGAETDPSGSRLEGVFVQDLAAARAEPLYGYSNAAGAYRTELWRRRPFREEMPGTEDKEWAWHWLNEGRRVIFDPALMVDHDHSHDPIPSVFERARREWVGFGMYLDLPPYPLRALAREWWSDLGGHETRMRARLSPWRAARLLGKYAGLRR